METTEERRAELVAARDAFRAARDAYQAARAEELAATTPGARAGCYAVAMLRARAMGSAEERYAAAMDAL